VPFAGRLLVDVVELRTLNVKFWREQIGLVQQGTCARPVPSADSLLIVSLCCSC
jgi:hypothetical protein